MPSRQRELQSLSLWHRSASLGDFRLGVGAGFDLVGLGLATGLDDRGLGFSAILGANARGTVLSNGSGTLGALGGQTLTLNRHALGVGHPALRRNAALRGFDLDNTRPFVRPLHLASAADFRNAIDFNDARLNLGRTLHPVAGGMDKVHMHDLGIARHAAAPHRQVDMEPAVIKVGAAGHDVFAIETPHHLIALVHRVGDFLRGSLKPLPACEDLVLRADEPEPRCSGRCAWASANWARTVNESSAAWSSSAALATSASLSLDASLGVGDSRGVIQCARRIEIAVR